MHKIDSVRLASKSDTLTVYLQASSLNKDTNITISFNTHNIISDHWFASISCAYSNKDDSWIGQTKLFIDRGKLSRAVSITNAQANGEDLVIDPRTRHFVLPPRCSVWKTGKIADNYLNSLKNQKRKLFDISIVEPGYTGNNEFLAIVIIENLNIKNNQQVPSLLAMPCALPSIHTAEAQVFESLLACFKITGKIDADSWLRDSSVSMPSAIIYAHSIRATNQAAAIDIATLASSRFIGLLALRRGDTPKIHSVLLGGAEPSGKTKYLAVRRYSPGWRGNYIGGILSGEDPYQLVEQWDYLIRSPRSRLWLSLYKDAISEQRWDIRVFRLFGLLELIADEVFGRGKHVTNNLGNKIPLHKSRNYTTTQAAGRVYKLIRSGQIAYEQELLISPNNCASRDFWQDVKLWTAIRNKVAHSGIWDGEPSNPALAKQWRVSNKLLQEIGEEIIACSIDSVTRLVLMRELEGKIKTGKGFIIR